MMSWKRETVCFGTVALLVLFILATFLTKDWGREEHRAIYAQQNNSHVVHTLNFPMNEGLDDTAALQKAIDAAGSGGRIWIPDGESLELEIHDRCCEPTEALGNGAYFPNHPNYTLPPIVPPIYATYGDHACVKDVDVTGRISCR